MRGLGKIVAQLRSARREIEKGSPGTMLGEVEGFGSNPGNLRARVFLPDGLKAGAALVVVLHGCTQNASIYDTGSGWSQLAAREGFALLYPEQQRSNNSNLCFNWYLPKDARRDRGEALSISQMVKHVAHQHGLDRSRIFITGLSAGGAMTSVMLAAYPELFAGGAIIAGLPFASANTLPEALERMRGQGFPSRSVLAARAQAAAPQSGTCPRLSIWHGSRDAIVDPANATAIADQWRDLHGLGQSPDQVEKVGQHRREVWRGDDGRELLETYDVRGMGHGTPLSTGSGERCGMVGPHMLDAKICSTSRIAAFWGLSEAALSQDEVSVPVEIDAVPKGMRPNPALRHPTQINKVIDDALRAAGLMS